MMGIEAVKSSTPAPCRAMIKDALKLMMSGTEDEVIDFIAKCRKTSQPPTRNVFPRSVSDVRKYKCSTNIYPRAHRFTLVGHFYSTTTSSGSR